MATTNKGLNQPVLGSTGWGAPLNENADILDLALGAFEIVAGTTGTISLSATQVQSMCLKSDTVAFVSDVTYIVPSGVAGQWLVTNQSAANAYSIIVKNAASGIGVSVPNGQSRLVYSDGTKVIYSTDQAAIATQAQAEAGTDNTTVMSPLRTSQQVQATIATQAEAEAGTDNATLMTPLRTAQANPYPYKNAQLFTASGSWVVPSGVTEVFAFVIGGGGGGAGNNSSSVANGNGGAGGAGYGLISVSGTVTVTIGAGGAGFNNTNNGAAGGSSTFGAITATGGGGGISSGASGAAGTASGASFVTSGSSFSQYLLTYAAPDSSPLSILTILRDWSGSSRRVNASSGTAAIPYSVGININPGSGGEGETPGVRDDATGGVGGAVLIFWS